VAHSIARPKRPPVTNWTTASEGAERSSPLPPTALISSRLRSLGFDVHLEKVRLGSPRVLEFGLKISF
jgi:hypothetical protein